ncbi:hypothetical protein VPNG_02936 [Cytospora leucostoma]|uniref:Uncharacterized protein n=1 Tax=Cytospora leucostoma TaxID=1230097 RepID=A0A423XFX8_9PEZI|nr:hypothetical protein VPNG_02936 [Cytospora leucostoma]
MTGAAHNAHAAQDIKSVLEHKPLKFQIKIGGAKYIGQVYPDRTSYERDMAHHTSSASSVTSTSTTGSR